MRARTPREMRAYIRTNLKPEGTCRVWTGYCDRYGYVMWQRRKWKVHRLRWILTHGQPAPSKPCVLHKCDNPACTRLGHLFTGTVAENNADMRAKGRSARGENHGRAKLTLKQVQAIRRAYATGRYSQVTLAKMFNVSRPTIGDIVNNKKWKEAS